MAQHKLTKQALQALVDAIAKAGGNQTLAARALGLNDATLRARVRVARAQGFKIPKPAEAGLTVNEAVLKQREKETAKFDNARHRDALAEIARLQDQLKQYEWAAGSFKPADWSLDVRKPKGKSPHIPMLLVSDAQAGEIVRQEETETKWPYNSEIFQKRYKRLIETTLYLSFEHRGSNWSFPGMIYVRGGDSISGGLHEDLREGGEDCTPLQQVQLVFEAEAWGLTQLADAFGKVEVKSPGAGGNHDRNTVKPRSKLAHARNYDALICYMLQKHFRNDKRITFQTSKSPDVRFPIFEQRMLTTHGDRIGSRGGQGFVGPGATILRGAQKVLMEQAALGHVVDTVLIGHLHYPIVLPHIVCNGSFTGTTEYGKQGRMRPIAPMQHLMFYAPGHGLVDWKPIYLAE